MKTFTVNTSSPYEIFIDRDIIGGIGEYVSSVFSPRKVCVITDSTVNGLYSQVVMTSLLDKGFQASKLLFPAGEHSKNLNTYSNILEALADEGLTRSDIILALGGGVTIDLAGFVASTYMRGIKYIAVPTTLQSAIDTSIGGKTGVNTLSGKNIVGSFWQPSLVVCDYKTFDTLPEKKLNDGVAEAIKCAVVAEAGLIPRIQNHDWEYVIDRCLSLKKSLVEVDEFDRGIRQLLNFGHTIAHGIEKMSSYSVTHGQAVAKGMVAEARGAYRMGLTNTDISEELSDILRGFGMDVSTRYDADELFRLALTDKKIKDGKISMTIPESLGKCSLGKISMSDLAKLISLGVEG